MADKQTTAVEWLIEKLTNRQNGVFDGLPILSMDEIHEQALAMGREQIQDAWISAWQDSMLEPLDRRFYEDLAEEYYTETYGKE